jgi:hypothetical protein
LRESAKARLAGPLPLLGHFVPLAFFAFVRLGLGLGLLHRARLLLLVWSVLLTVPCLAPVVVLAWFFGL